MKLKVGFGVLFLLLINVVTAYAQLGPPNCGTVDDPDAPCPLDTWVIVLVVAFALFAAYKLQQRKKAFNKPSL
jgi:hypothetical protein